MAQKKNVAGQHHVFEAIDTTDGSFVTGDAGNITVTISIDGGAGATATNAVAEISSMAGFYAVDLTQAETNGDIVAIKATSSTADVRCSSAVYQTIDSTDAVVDAVWDEALSGHTTAGTAGETLSTAELEAAAAHVDAGSASVLCSTNNGLLNNINSNAGGTSLADQVDAVWDEDLTTHSIASSTGEKLAATSEFDNTVEDVRVSVIGGDVVTGVNDLKADVSGLSTFDNSIEEVNVGRVNGTIVSGPDDFKADVSGLSTFDPSAETVDVSVSSLSQVVDVLHGASPTAGTIGEAMKLVTDFLDDINTNASVAASESSTAATQATSAASNSSLAASRSLTAATESSNAAADTQQFSSNGIALNSTASTTLVTDIWRKALSGRPAEDRLIDASEGEFLQDTSDINIDGQTVEQALRIVLAALAGKLSGAGTNQVTIRDASDTKNRIVADVDAEGNRSNFVTLDGS